jgi:hypothetical protein
MKSYLGSMFFIFLYSTPKVFQIEACGYFFFFFLKIWGLFLPWIFFICWGPQAIAEFA